MRVSSDVSEYHPLNLNDTAAFFAKIRELKLEVNSFILLQDGQRRDEFYREPYRKDCPQLLYSLSKSFTSIATGIAWDHGLLRLDDPVVSFFPDQLPDVISPNLSKMTVHHLLSMTAGHHDNIYEAVAREQDWVKAFLSLEVEHEPGSYYLYSTHSTYMLAAILEQVTGQNLVDYLMPTLFEPLDIPRPSWETCPMGITAGGMGLSLSTENVAKFGQLLLNKGTYEGRRIVSERYIELATTKHSDTDAIKERVDWQQGYGYQFHLCRRDCYRGDGSFGQLCFVAPQENIVIAANASFKSMKPLQTLLDLIYEYILDPINESDNGSSGVMQGDQVTSTSSSSPVMASAVPDVHPVSIGIPDIDGRSYLLSMNPHGLQKLSFYMRKNLLEVHSFYGDERDTELLFNFEELMNGRAVFYKDLSLHLQEVVTHAIWRDENTLTLTLFYIETPYIVTYTISFLSLSTIDVQLNMNVSLGIPRNFQVRGYLI